jgi:AraC-like DNA-binding protein
MMQTLPLRFDLFALIILLGIAQGVFLGVSFLSGGRGSIVANRCLGGLMLALSAILTEMWLAYTNYMFRTLAIIDFAEPFNFVLGPLFFFFVFSRIQHRLPRRWGWHLVPFAIWLINSITWMYQPITFKYNAFVNAWHPELSFVPTDFYLPHDFTGLRGYINELTLLSCLIYLSWSIWVVYGAYRQQDLSFWSRTGGRRLSLLRSMSLLNVLFPVLIGVVKYQFYEDLGDHILASYVTLTIYATSFFVLRDSDFFRHEPPLAPPAEPAIAPLEPRKKYEKSALSPEVEEAILSKLNHLTTAEKLYLTSDFSLPKLADQLGSSPHYVSQVLNDRLGQTFFDWLAAHRIAEAQQLLSNPATAHLKIEEIAERVGYNAPSAFHTAFKRITGQTPAAFRSAQSS